MTETEKNATAWAEFTKTMKNPAEKQFDAARQGDTVWFQQNLTKGVSLEDRDARGATVLMLAAYHGHQTLTNILLHAGADANTSDNSGNSVLMGASFKGYTEIVHNLIQAGADPHYCNPNRQTALQFAQMFGRRETISYLLHLKLTNTTNHFDSLNRFGSGLFSKIRAWALFAAQWAKKIYTIKKRHL